MPPLEDPGVAPVLRHFGIKPGVLLGQGGEAQTYSLDEERVLRVHHDRTPRETVDARASLLTELARSADVVPFAIPRVLETLEIDTRIVTIERRLTGRPLTELLAEATGNAREALVRAHLDAAFRLGDLAIGQRGYGDLCQSKPIRTGRFRTYLERRATRSLRGAGTGFAHVDAKTLADALPEPDEPAFVHLDAFMGNMLGEGETITAVLDFGVVALSGDRRLDPLAAVAYLAPDITPAANDADRAVAQKWLAETDLAPFYLPARRWLAAFWCAARDSARLQRWCRSVLCE